VLDCISFFNLDFCWLIFDFYWFVWTLDACYHVADETNQSSLFRVTCCNICDSRVLWLRCSSLFSCESIQLQRCMRPRRGFLEILDTFSLSLSLSLILPLCNVMAVTHVNIAPSSLLLVDLDGTLVIIDGPPSVSLSLSLFLSFSLSLRTVFT